MTEAQRAAFRILTATPAEKIRTHHWKPEFTSHQGGRMPIEQTIWLHNRILELRGQGWKQKDIAPELGVSKLTVSRHCRNLVKACNGTTKYKPTPLK